MPDISDETLMQMVQEAERRRIARELHDGSVQSLSALITDLESFRRYHLGEYDLDTQQLEIKVDTWLEQARTSLQAMRKTLDGLRSQTDPDLDLLVLIRALLAEMQRHGYIVSLDVSNWPAVLPAVYSSNLYYCIYEAVTNIRKHAHATNIDVFLFVDEKTLHISVIDDGIGLTVASTRQGQPGTQQGLIGLQERVSLLGGQFVLTSEPEQGTRVDIAIPLI
jgi:two-component system, NarL family, sensor histidine kinase DegS